MHNMRSRHGRGHTNLTVAAGHTGSLNVHDTLREWSVPLVWCIGTAVGTFTAIAAGWAVLGNVTGWQFLLAGASAALTGIAAGAQAHKTTARRALQQITTVNNTKQAERRDAIFQLPPDIHDFTGHGEEFGQLRALLNRERNGDPSAMVISAISGKGGVGKTALAVHVAHRERHRFPDGQLFVDLNGVSNQPREPSSVLDEFLRALGVDPQIIPEDLDGRSRMYRARLSSRRVLLVLDNAVNEAQVRPLLPGNSDCAVLITSRAPLGGLDSMRRVALDVLNPDEALALLGKIIGKERINADPESAGSIVNFCGCLPLALRIVGGKLSARRHWSLAKMSGLLAEERRRLGRMKIGDLDLRATFALSYGGRSAEERRVFCLLGFLEVTQFTAWLCAALLDLEFDDAQEVMESLADAQLLEIGVDIAGGIRYRFHDLIRLFSLEQGADEPSESYREALGRALDTYHRMARRAASRIDITHAFGDHDPPDDDRYSSQEIKELVENQPSTWFDIEYQNIIALIHQAYSNDYWDVAWKLTETLLPFFEIRSHWADWERTYQTGLHAAERAGSDPGQAAMHYGLGYLYRDRSRFELAATHLQSALRGFQSSGDRRGEAYALLSLGIMEQKRLNFTEALDFYERCLLLFRALNDRHGEAYTQREKGVVLRNEQRFDAAAVELSHSLHVFRELGDRRGEAYASLSLGIAQERIGNRSAALSSVMDAMALFRELGDSRWEGYALRSLGEIYLARKKFDMALSALQACLTTFRQLGDARWEGYALESIGSVHVAKRRYDAGLACFAQAAALFDQLNIPRLEGRLRIRMGEVLITKRDPAAAATELRAALEILQRAAAPEAAEAIRLLGQLG